MARNEESARQNKEIEESNRKGEFEGLIFDRSKSQQEIDTRIDQLDGEFQKAECHGEIPELDIEWGRYSEGLGEMLPVG